MKKSIGSIILAIAMLISGTVLLAACGLFSKNAENDPASQTYTVSFYDGTTLKEEKTVEAGKTVTPPSMEDTNSQHFVGWLINGEEGNYFTEETVVQSDMKVYALWMRFVTVSFDLNGGEGTANSIATYAGAEITLPSGEDFVFGDRGLYAWSDGDREYAPGATYSVGGADIVLSAVWGTRYTATFDLGDGTGTAPAQMVSTRSIILPDATGFSKAGYTFDGWMLNGKVYKSGATYPLNGNVSFTAVFAGAYKLTLNKNDGTDAEVVTRNTGDTYVLPTPTRTGWKFLNWKQGEQTIAAGTTFTFGYADVTLEAEWSDEVTVSYKDWDKYTFTTQSIKNGTALPAPGGEFGLTDVAEFTGWKDADGNEYTVGTTPITSDVVLYAQYTQNNYTTYTVNDFSFTATNNGQAYLIEEVRQSFLGAKTELYFPATFRGKPVIGTIDSSDEGATFHNFLKGTADATYTSSANSLHKVVIPSTWTVIGNSTFTNCRALTEVVINGPIERIGEWGFYYCYSLTGFTIPTTLREMSSNSFSACAKLENFAIAEGGNSNFSVEDGVLFNADKTELLCYNFGNERTSYEVPASVQTIASLAFDHRGNYYRPETTSSAPNGGYHLTGAITFAAGSALKTVCTYAFGYTHCTISLPASLRTVKAYAFNYAEKAVTFEEGITELAAEAFRAYKGNSIALPSTLKTIGESCFRGAFSLESVTFPKGCNVTDIGAYAFTASNKLEKYPFNEASKLKTIGEYAFSSPDSGGTMGLTGDVEFPATLVSIGDYAFSRNPGIKSVKFAGGNALKTIGTGAFGECTSLAKVEFVSVTQFYEDVAPRCFYLCEALASVKLPAGIKRIGVQAFAGTETRPNKALTTVEIPSTCTLIAGNAFESNTKLQSVTFQAGGSADLEIGAAFNNCTALETFEIPARTKAISVRVFEQVTTLQVTSQSDLYPAFEGSLYGISAGTESTQEKTLLYAYVDPATHILNVAEGTTRIAAYACAYNENLVTLNLPQTLTYIGARAFTYALNLETVTQAEGGAVKTIDDYAFAGSAAAGGPSMKVREFPFREGLEEIGTGAFENNSGLTEVNIPASYHITFTTKENILTGEIDEMNTGGYAFSNCAALQKITFAEGCKVKELPVAFANWCPNLTTVVFGENSELERLKGIAFMSCPKLNTVVLPMARVVDVLNNVFTSGDDSKPLSITVYVADSLVGSYQVNENWKTNLSKCRPTFLPYTQYKEQMAE